MFQSYNEPPYAGFWIRFAAYLLDSLILSVVSCPLGFGVGMIGAVAEVDQNSPEWLGVNLLLNGIVIFASWLYFALMESSSWQGTVGKKVLKLKVTDTNGYPIGFGKASGRYFGKLLSSMICLIGFIMAAFSEKKQGLHDILASTLVVHDVPPLYEPPPPPPDFSYRPSDYPGGNY